MKQDEEGAAQALQAGKAYRILTGIFGLFLLGVGVYVLGAGVSPGFMSALGAAVLLALGANAVLAAMRGTRSWIACIGPLP